MSSSTINTTINNTVTLGSGSYSSSVSIASGGAIFGNNGNPGTESILVPVSISNFSIVNQGSLVGGLGQNETLAGQLQNSANDLRGGVAISSLSYGSIANGYQIIGGTGGDGGRGSAGTSNNLQTDGGTGGFGDTGGDGGAAVKLTSGALQNTGNIIGGTGGTGGIGGSGGAGAVGGAGGYGGNGGHGGDGIHLDSGSILNSGLISGGKGGDGGHGGAGGGGPITGATGGSGAGGTGGTGIYITQSAMIENDYQVFGGAGGYGAIYGGTGGTGANVALGTLINHGLIVGGSGGGVGAAGNGDAGGEGIYLVSGNLQNFGTISGGSGGPTGLRGEGLKSVGGTITNEGKISGGETGSGGVGAYLVAGATMYNNGMISGDATPDSTTGSTCIGAVVGDATLINAGTISDGSSSPNTSDEAISFVGNGTIISDVGSVIDGSIAGFAPGDMIIADGISMVSATYASLVTTLTLNGGATLDILGAFSADDFLFNSAAGNTSIELKSSIACFCPGTNIMTPNGEIAIENLSIGDWVRTQSGVERIKWIGHRAYDGRFIAGNHLVLPIIICARALGPNVPARDLLISPGHAIFVGGTLIPAWRLLNGASIRQMESVDHVEYFHVELESHNLIFAEKTPVESFLDVDLREQFDNRAEFYRLYPEANPAQPLMPRTESGFALHAIQRAIASRAGVRHSDRVGPVCGFIEKIEQGLCVGWALYTISPDTPVVLDIFIDQQLVQRVIANEYRNDLRAAKLGSGCHGFSARLPMDVSGQASVRVVATGERLKSLQLSLVA